MVTPIRKSFIHRKGLTLNCCYMHTPKRASGLAVHVDLQQSMGISLKERDLMLKILRTKKFCTWA